jgi:hypothetical protein
MKSKRKILFDLCLSEIRCLQNGTFRHAGEIGVYTTFGGSRISTAKAGFWSEPLE